MVNVVSAEISAREAEVLAAIGEHLTNAEIAGRLDISVRTVESHVSSLLRKFGVADRRALALESVAPALGAGLPAPLTSFVGRAGERAALAAAIATSRLVSAVGPGGVGKTRLALAVAGDLQDQFTGGVWYVDLVPVTDPTLVVAAVAGALGVGERQGRSTFETVTAWFADRSALLILDNCEQVQDGVGPLVERLLAGCPELRVLATSRSRLLLPFERVYAVPGLSVAPDGDAVALFRERAAAAGVAPDAGGLDGERIAAVCRSLDGSALAIELAAARLPTLGLDGLAAALADPLDLLTGGSRAATRHRSLRSTLDWSYALLDPAQQAVLRRVSVFAVPFTAAAAVVVTGWEPATAVSTALDRLAEQSLLVPAVAGGIIHYRSLETVRQYGGELLTAAGELEEAQDRHLRWCLDQAAALAAAPVATANQAGLAALPPAAAGAWRATFDGVVHEIRTALRIAAQRPDRGTEAFELARLLARLSFARGFSSEAQRRFEQAAALAGVGSIEAAAALRDAAGAAEVRRVGTEAIRLHRAAAAAAIAAGDRPAAARDLARAAEVLGRYGRAEAHALLAEARRHLGDDPAALARLLAAESFIDHPTAAAALGYAARARDLARAAGDRLTESAASGLLTLAQLAIGEIGAALRTASGRIELLAATPITAGSAMEIADVHHMAAECALAVGDLPRARLYAEQIRAQPFHREEAHLGNARLIVVTVLIGDFSEAARLGELFRDSWERAGRPRAGNLSRAAYAVATLHGLRGDEPARAAWLTVLDYLVGADQPAPALHYVRFFEALLQLHAGAVDRAYAELAGPPDDQRDWHDGIWRAWYAALWAEAAVLSGSSDAAGRIALARPQAAANPVAAALVDRAAAVHARDRAGIVAAADALAATGCRYQWARTAVLLGGAEGERGASTLAQMGATPTRWPLVLG